MTMPERNLATKLSAMKMDRRALLRRTAIGLGAAAFLPLLAACAEDDDGTADEDPPASAEEDDDEEVTDDVADDAEDPPADAGEGQFGGTLNVAIHTTPASLDVQATADHYTRTIGMHMFETLLTYDEAYEFAPLLAATWDWNEDGDALTLGLRDDVVFHNGQEMVADDVIASIERYAESGNRGVVGESFESVNEIDSHTVEITLPEADSGFLPILASPLVYLAIMPREHIEGRGAGDLSMEDLVGTGPYQLEEWIPDSEVRMSRFDDYYETEGQRDGYSGAKIAYFDEVVCQIVVETGTRVSGLLAGDYDIATVVPPADLPRLEDDPDVEASIGGPGLVLNLEFNHHEDAGLSANPLFRQAVLARANMEELGNLVSDGNPEFFEMNPSLYRSEQEQWWTDVAEELWNQNDPDRAQELLDEMGYDGEEFIMVCQDQTNHQSMCLGLAEQLREIGVNVETQQVDRPGQDSIVENTSGWHARSFSFTMRFTPADWDATLSCATDRVYWCNEEMEDVFRQIQRSFDEDDQKVLSDDIQRIHHEEVFSITLPVLYELHGYRADLHGYERWYLDRFWGIWREN